MKSNKDIEQLFRDNYEAMYTFARCILYDDAEAKNVVSDVFEKILNKDTVLLPSTAKGYLLRAVQNLCVNIINHKSVREKVEKLLPVDVAEDDDNEEQWQKMMEAIEDLEPPVRREILLLRYHDGMSYQEVATKIGISKVTVYNQLSKAIETLRSKLK